ncbi:hypothetical protein I4U23_022322 [Adineta vaga]|nr:hypothetical protein I4U23_022322 [Adineta vaga]
MGDDNEKTHLRNQTMHTLVNQIQDTFAKNDYSRYFILPTTETYTYGPLWKGHDRIYRVVFADSFKTNRTTDVAVPTCGGPSKPETFFEHPGSSFLPTSAQLAMSLLSNILAQPACMKNKTVFFDLLAQSDVYSRLVEMGRTNQAIKVSLERCLLEINKFPFDTLETHGVDSDLVAACLLFQWTPPYDLIENVGKTTIGPAYIILPLDQSIDLELTNVNMHDMYFRIYNTSYVERVLEVYLTEIINRPQDYIGGRIFTEIYPCPASDALLSPTRGLPSIRISILSTKRTSDTYAQVYRKFWHLFERHGLPFTVHWGKILPIHQQDRTIWCRIRAQYQDDGALSIFKTLVEAFDPVGIFRDAYWHELFWIDDC